MQGIAMQKKEKRAVEALEEAQKIAFAPFVFQATVALRKLKVFDLIFDQRKNQGITIEDLSKKLHLSTYGLGVLLEIAESSDLVTKGGSGKYQLTKTGYFLNYNKTIDVNINFTNDVCYKGLFHLPKTIETGRPEGLQELGNWPTIYEGLSQLPQVVQKSWFEFDHHYSDEIFDDALKRVFQDNPREIFDIGGNTGKFALKCLSTNDSVRVTIFDLPGQLNKALDNIETVGFKERVTAFEIDWLKEHPKITKDADIIWMSQFLDCFSEDEILKILSSCAKAMNTSTELLITETFTDRQKFESAKFALEATSLYFTVMANGNSKMYPSTVFKRLIDNAGLKITEDTPIGEFHTMLVCKLK